MNSDSISHWIEELKAGEGDAARQLWDRYVQRVTGLAKRRLAGHAKRVADEDDVAQSVFRSLCLGAPKGNFPELANRDDLWHLLAKITNRKAVNRIRWANRKKRGGGDVRGESVLDGKQDGDTGELDEFTDAEDNPALNAEMADECRYLMDSLPDETYRFVIWKRLEGHTNEEISELLGVTTRSVERKIQNTRDLLSRRLDIQ